MSGPAPPEKRRRPWLWPLVGVLVFVGLFAALTFTRPKGRSELPDRPPPAREHRPPLDGATSTGSATALGSARPDAGQASPR